MGKVCEYAFINAKLRARIGEMHQSTLLEAMIKAPSLVESIGTLKDTRYSELVRVYDSTGDLQQVELALLEAEIEVHREIARYLKDREVGFVSILLEKVEIDNLKNAVRLWYSNIVRHHQISYRSSYICKQKIVNDINYNGIINARDYEGILSSVKDTPYYEVFSLFDLEKLSISGLFPLEIALDHLWFKRLFISISTLKGEDREVSENIYLVDTDLKNILLFIRYSSYHHLDPKNLEKVMIPYGGIYQEVERKKIFSLSDPATALQTVVRRKYPALMADLADIRKNDDEMTTRDENANHILMMEEYLGRTRKKEFTKILSGKPFTIGITLAYLFLYKEEDRMIRAILSAKYYKWSESRIREGML